jgi:hypothetical protein
VPVLRHPDTTDGDGVPLTSRDSPLLVFLPASGSLIPRWAADGVQAGRRPPRRGRRALTPSVPSARCPGWKHGPDWRTRAAASRHHPRQPGTSSRPAASTAQHCIPVRALSQRPTAPAGEPHMSVPSGVRAGKTAGIHGRRPCKPAAGSSPPRSGQSPDQSSSRNITHCLLSTILTRSARPTGLRVPG